MNPAIAARKRLALENRHATPGLRDAVEAARDASDTGSIDQGLVLWAQGIIRERDRFMPRRHA